MTAAQPSGHDRSADDNAVVLPVAAAAGVATAAEPGASDGTFDDDTVVDEVDRIVAAWERERPDLQPLPLHIFSRVNRLARHLDLARREAFADHGVEGWEFDVLSALRRSGAPYELTPGRLIAETLVSSGTMTNRIDRMVGHGLVVRAADPTDRRVVKVRLTAEGKARVDAAMSALLASEHKLLSALSDDERELLSNLLRRLLLHFDGS